MAEETFTIPEKKPRKPRRDTSFVLVSEIEQDGVGKWIPVRADKGIKQLRKEAEKLEDGEYVIVSIRDRFTKSTTQTAVLKRG